MRPDSQTVLALLRQLSEDPDNRTVRHSICVGDAAATIAAALIDKGYDLDVDQVRALGYLHDIGRLIGPGDEHIVNGYKYLKSQGFADEYCNICLIHSFPEERPNGLLSAPFDPAKDQFLMVFLAHYERTLTDKIIILCDLMCKYDVWTIDRRIVDVIARHGAWSGTQRCIIATRELKSEIDTLLGENVYHLFPEIGYE